MPEIDYHTIIRPLLGLDEECGDMAVICRTAGCCFLGLVDGVGHGPKAHEVARLACEFLESRHQGGDLAQVMLELHEHLRGSRGAVAACCRVALETGEFAYAGIGNITVRILGPTPLRLVPQDGLLGSTVRLPVTRHGRLGRRDALVMHTDGIREHFETLDCVGLLQGTPEQLAVGILERFGKRDDDASCIVARWSP